MSINQVTLTCVYLALNPLLPKEIYLKILAIKKFIPISRPPSSSGKVICSLIIWLQPFIFLFFVFGGRNIFYTVTGRALFFSFDLWKWPGHFSRPYLAAGFVLVHTAVVESCSTNQNSRMARAWKEFFCCNIYQVENKFSLEIRAFYQHF